MERPVIDMGISMSIRLSPRNAAPKGLDRLFGILNLGTGNHYLLHFVMKNVGASHVLFYTCMLRLIMNR